MPYPTIPNLELSELAEADLEDIMHYTYLNFGAAQVDTYLEALLRVCKLLQKCLL